MKANEADTPGANATPVTPAQEAVRRWRDGAKRAPSMSLREMGKVARVGKDTVARSRGGRAAIVRGADEKTYLSAEARTFRASVVLGLGAEGWSIRRIAEATGINRETVRRDLRDYRSEP